MSKTDHPRFLGSHQVGHAPRSWREMGKGDRIEYGTPKRVVTALMAVTEIHEAVMTEEAVEPDLCKFCRTPLTLTPVAEWERQLLQAEDTETVLDYCNYSCMNDHLAFANDGFTWFNGEEVAEPQDDCEGWEFHDSDWLPLVTIEECRDIFGGGDFIIDHTNVSRAKPVRWF